MNHSFSVLESRSLPRFDLSLPITIGHEARGRVVDISDNGLCFISDHPLSARQYEIDLTLRIGEQTAHVLTEIVWTRTAPDGQGIVYGGKILRWTPTDLAEVRRRYIFRYFRSFTKRLRDRRVRSHILYFAKKCRDYILALADLDKKAKRSRFDNKDVQTDFAKLTDEIMLQGFKLEKELADKRLYENIKRTFRKLVSSWAFKSPIVKRSYDKPQGFPGDYRVLEAIYDGAILSTEPGIGQYFDAYFQQNPYAVAVRNRKDFIKKKLQQVFNEDRFKHRREMIKVLNLACGSCREIRELLPNFHQSEKALKVVFDCIDWDDEALSYCKTKLNHLPEGVTCNFVKADIRDLIKSVAYFDREGKYELIYSIGLADYLPDRVITRLIKNAFYGLMPAGSLILAHKDKEIFFSHLPPEWFCDWTFISRNQADFMQLIDQAQLKNCNVEIERDITQQIFFVTLTKKV